MLRSNRSQRRSQAMFPKAPLFNSTTLDLFWFQQEELVTIGRTNRDLTDLDSPEKTKRDIHTCVANFPNLTIKICKPVHGFPLYAKNEVSGSQACPVSRTSCGNLRDENTAVGLFRIDPQPGSGW